MKTASMLTLTLSALLAFTPTFAGAQQMDPNMPGMHHEASPEAQGVGVVKAIDTAKGTITLQHEAITSLGWPAMTMPFKVASPELLKAAKVGDKVKFTLHPAGANTTITAITPAS